MSCLHQTTRDAVRMCPLLRVFLLISMVLVSAQYEVGNMKKSWSSANSLCELAGSNLSGEVKIEKVATNSTKRGQSYWIGAYAQHTPWFDVFTCRVVNKENIILKSGVKISGNDQPLYDCYDACKDYRVFALSENACYCSYGLQMLGNSCQNRRSSSSSFDVYGYSTTPASWKIAILQYDTNFIQGDLEPYNGTGTGNCAAALLRPGSTLSTHEFLPCETKLPFLCSGKLINEAVDWAKAVEICDQFVLSSSWSGRYEYDEPVVSLTRAWTATSRRSQLYWGQDDTKLNNTLCLALRVDQNGETSFSARICEEELPFLCEKGTMKTTTSQAAETTPSSLPDTTVDNRYSTPEFHSTVSIDPTESATTNSTQQRNTTEQPEPPTSSLDPYTVQVTSTDVKTETTNSTVEDLPYQSDSSYLLLLAAMLAGVVLLVIIVVLCLIYKRERTRHLFSSVKKKENADTVYSVVKRNKCHTKELRDILDTLSDTSYDVDISAQMTEKHPSDFYSNASFDPSEGDDFSHWYRSSLLIQVIPEGQTHTLMVSDLHPTPDTDTGDDLYSHIIRNIPDKDTTPQDR